MRGLFKVSGLAVMVALSACAGDDVGSVDGGATDDGPAAQPDPSQPGPFRVGVWETTLEDYVAMDGSTHSLELVVWYPTDEDGETNVDTRGIPEAAPSQQGPFPVVAHSHGYLGGPTNSLAVVTHLVSHGFVVPALGHPDAKLGRAASFMDRPLQVQAAVDFVEAESSREQALLHGVVDGARAGVMGHSFGALTTLALLAKGDTRFAAGMSMAPGIREVDVFDIHPELPKIEDPLMFMMGEQDQLATYPDLSAAYRTLPDETERFAFVLPNANHDIFNDECVFDCESQDKLDVELGHRLINTRGTAFMQVYVAGRPEFQAYLEPNDAIADGEARLYKGPLP